MYFKIGLKSCSVVLKRFQPIEYFKENFGEELSTLFMINIRRMVKSIHDYANNNNNKNNNKIIKLLVLLHLLMSDRYNQ